MMKNKSVLFVFFLIVFTLTSFSQDNKNIKEELVRISINSKNFKSSGNLSDFLEVTKLIPLETSKESLIRQVDKVVQFRKNIYVYDLSLQKLFWFNTDGKFLGLIGQRGKGPGEYLEMHDIQVDTINELIYLPDVRKVHVFSTNGKWIRTVNTEFMGSNLSLSTNNEFVFYGAGRDDRIWITDSNFKVINSFFPYSLAYRMDPRYPLSKYKDQTIFQIPTCDTIFTLKDGKPRPLFYLDFNGKNFTNKDFDRLSLAEQNNLFDYLLNSGKYVMCQGFLPLKNSALITMIYSNAAYWGIYNLNTHQYSIVPLMKLNNDIFGPFMYLHPTGMTNDEYIFAVAPDKLVKDKNSSFYKKNIEILKGINENSNPVLLLAKPRI